MNRTWMRPLDLAIPEDVCEELDRLAREAHRRRRDQAAFLLIDAVRRASAGGDPSLAALAAAFEADGQRWFSQADSPSAGLVRRLLLQTRGEAWLQAAARLRAAIPDTSHTEARSALPGDRPTAA